MNPWGLTNPNYKTRQTFIQPQGMIERIKTTTKWRIMSFFKYLIFSILVMKLKLYIFVVVIPAIDPEFSFTLT